MFDSIHFRGYSGKTVCQEWFVMVTALQNNPYTTYRLEQRGAVEKIFSTNSLNPKLISKLKYNK